MLYVVTQVNHADMDYNVVFVTDDLQRAKVIASEIDKYGYDGDVSIITPIVMNDNCVQYLDDERSI